MYLQNIDAIIIPSSDPHLSEYLPNHWKIISWISGFTGSAGTFVLTRTKSGLWTDSRYYIQAENQLLHSTIELYKDGLCDTPSIIDFIQSEIKEGGIIAIDGEITSINYFTSLQNDLKNYKVISDNLNICNIWLTRPPLPTTKAEIYDVIYCGKTINNKLQDIRSSIDLKNSLYIITSLDEIAWTLNIRGSEIENNPVVISYLTIEENQATLYIDNQKVTSTLKEHLLEASVYIKEYSELFDDIRNYKHHLVIDPSCTNYRIFASIQGSTPFKYLKSPIALFKAKRNNIEIKNLNQAMLKDGVAMVQFLMWLEENKTNNITEIDVAKKLINLRSKQANYKGESFATIAGYEEHGAIVHYTASKESNSTLKAEGLILVDSGAQYLEGTTDLTRTISLGKVSPEQCEDYTIVLKGHIALAKAKFPKGTRGSQLDILARLPLWERKKNFLHGTGHGVGHYLCVHEGPQSIRMQENPIQLEKGMLTSNEPGLYIAGKYGIRIESLLLVTSYGEGLFGEYQQFDTVTLCPIDIKPIKKQLLTQEEINWLNNYHEHIYQKLAPLLNEKEQSWLKINTTKI